MPVQSSLRGHFQTIFLKINVIMTLRGEGVRAMTLNFSMNFEPSFFRPLQVLFRFLDRKLLWKQAGGQISSLLSLFHYITTTLGSPSELHAWIYTSVMIHHRHGASLSEQHNDLLCTKQDLSHTSRYVDESSPEIARYRKRMPTARTATLSVTTYV